MIKRIFYLDEITNEFKVHQVCCLLGPRQCGKTTLALEYKKKYPGESFLFDLENPEDLEALLNPLRALEDLKGLVIIDEIQRLPNLYARKNHGASPVDVALPKSSCYDALHADQKARPLRLSM